MISFFILIVIQVVLRIFWFSKFIMGKFISKNDYQMDNKNFFHYMPIILQTSLIYFITEKIFLVLPQYFFSIAILIVMLILVSATDVILVKQVKRNNLLFILYFSYLAISSLFSFIIALVSI